MGGETPPLQKRPVWGNMKFDAEKHHRKSIRLKDYDYSQEGAYFVTVCAHNREMVFDDERFRKIVETYWFDLPRHYPHAELDEFVVMPNHVHAIIVINDKNVDTVCRGEVTSPGGGVGGETPPLQKRPGLGKIVAYYKYQTTKLINELRRTPGEPVWQRNYWEHIIRSQESFNKIREYIMANPAQWENDPENPGVEMRGRKYEKPRLGGNSEAV
jgi:REP element-mobilizing transposase RayT